MIEIEFVGGPQDGGLQMQPVAKPSKFFKQTTSNPVRLDQATGNMVYIQFKYRLDSTSINPQGYVRAKYVLCEQKEVTKTPEDAPTK